MNVQQQPHSCVKREGRDYREVPRPMTTGTRMLEIGTSFISNPGGFNNWFIPLYNLLSIQQGTQSNQRVGNSILIHRIEFEYVYKANQDSVFLPEMVNPDTSRLMLQDPSMRIMIVQPKQMYRVAPVSNTLTYPYYSTTGSSEYPEPIVPPVDVVNPNLLHGILGLPDPKKFDLEYDDVKNLQQDSITPYSTGQFTFLVRKRFDYDQERLNSQGLIYFTDSEVFNSIPQIWFFTPNNGATIAGNNLYKFNFNFYMRIIYDNLT